MDEANLAGLLHKEISRIFFGTVPELYDGIVSGQYIDAVGAAIQKQPGQTVFTLNYVIFIQDIGEFLSPAIKILIQNNSLNANQIRQYQSLNRTLFTSMYLSVIQDMENETMVSKITLSHFLRTFLQTITEIYQVEILEDQDGFIALTNRHEAEQRELLASYNTLILKIRTEEDIPVNSDDLLFGKYNTKQLEVFEGELKRQLLVEPNSTGLPLISTGFLSGTVKINWRGKQGALIYCLYLLNESSRELLPDRLTVFASKRFTVSEETVTPTQFSKSLNNIHSRYTVQGKVKPAFLLQIEKIVALVRSTKQ